MTGKNSKGDEGLRIAASPYAQHSIGDQFRQGLIVLNTNNRYEIVAAATCRRRSEYDAKSRR